VLLKLRRFTFLVMVLLFGCNENQPQLKPLSDNAVILAFGDSLTYGIGAATGQSYPEVLSQLTGHSVVNAGISGEISAEGLQRLATLLNKHQPELLILMHGANDILRKLPLQTMRANIEKMLQLAQERKIQVLMVGVPKFNLFALNSAPLYAEVAASYQVPIELEVLPEILSQRDLKSDTVHPNQAGYQLMAERIFVLLQTSGAL